MPDGAAEGIFDVLQDEHGSDMLKQRYLLMEDALN
jgi:hypothetical protein